MQYNLLLSVLLSTLLLTSCIQNSQKKQFYTITADSVKQVFKYLGGDPRTYYLMLGEETDVGTDGYPGTTHTLYFDDDTLVFKNKNFPFLSDTIIHIKKGKELFKVRLRYNGVSAFFPPAYRAKYDQSVQVEIPEVYELANILWALSQDGKYANTLPRDNDYFREVSAYFSPFIDHPIFEKLQVPDSVYFQKYFEFRENSFAFQFDGDSLVRNGPHYFVYGNDWADFTSFFSELAPLVSDFANASNFRQFYQSHQPYYQSMIQEQSEMIPVRNIWDWMEKEFPNRKFNSYRIVFSPLINDSHSTQNFVTVDFTKREPFRESVMFVCGNRYASDKTLSRGQMQGLMAGIFLTEVDHNYVNSASRKYREDIGVIFENRDFWANDQVLGYQSPMAVFNEYMTHAIYSLWVMENFDEKTTNFLIDYREKLNIKRGFIRFPAFNQALIKVKEANPDKKTMELYPHILEWCKDILSDQ